MKFLCDNCKAKYQISDEKVAGKTVRMKCRKCGHQIEVRATPDTSTALLPPGPGAEKKPLATALAGRAPHPPRPPSPARADAPKLDVGSSLASAFQKSVQQQAESLTPAPRQSDIPPLQLMTDLSVTDEWYVAINGVPVGPIRISEIRRKAAAGAVTEDSLVWQEGLEEWRPVRAVTELAQIVREAAAEARPSLAAPGGGERISQLPPATAHVPSNSAIPARRPTVPNRPEPLRPAASALRNNVVPISSRLATAERLDEEVQFAHPTAALPPPPALAGDPFAIPAPNGDPFAPAKMAQPLPVPQALQRDSAIPGMMPAAGAMPYGAAAQAAAATPRESFAGMPPAQPQRKGPPLWFILVAVFAGCFGIALAVLMFMPKPVQPPPAPVVIQMPAPAGSAPAPVAADDNREAPPADSTAPAGSNSAGKVAVAAGGGTKGGTSPTPAPSQKTADLSSLLGGAGGPSGGPGGGGGGGGGGGLDANAVQNVVRSRAPGVKRTCWERGGGDQKSSANVTVAVNVAPNGSVSSASATGDDPVIAKCIENQVRGWQFPPPGSPTTVNIPFHFVRQ